MKDLSNQTFGNLTVLSRAESVPGTNGHLVQRWLCKCACGNTCIVRHGNLTSGTSTSCGCIKKEATSKRKLKDLTGKQFGELTVLRRASEIGSKRVMWLCLCSCGHFTIVSGCNLKSGNTTSCGCLRNSFAESVIVNYLVNHNIKYKKEAKFKDLLSSKGNPLRFDFMIYTDASFFLLEYQGVQHFDKSHRDFGRYERDYSDAEKKKYCQKNNIELIEISYKDNLTASLDKIMFSHKLLHDNSVPSTQEIA